MINKNVNSTRQHVSQILEATVHEICKTSNRFESTFIPRRRRIYFLAAQAARLDEVVSRWKSQ